MSFTSQGHCPLCQQAGQTSIVRVDCTIRTTLAVQNFADEEGMWHYHDPNVTISHYKCSKDHSWSETRYTPCPCGWSAETDRSERANSTDTPLK
jgi:hypothetical protein